MKSEEESREVYSAVMRVSETDHGDLIQRLRDSAKGRHYWRCLHKLDKSMRIQFEDWEGHEAKEWFKEHLERFPESYRDYEMVRVHVLDQSDRLMIEAADALETKIHNE